MDSKSKRICKPQDLIKIRIDSMVRNRGGWVSQHSLTLGLLFYQIPRPFFSFSWQSSPKPLEIPALAVKELAYNLDCCFGE